MGIVATLLAGGSFVPLDPSWPQARRESVTHDASLSFVLTPDNCALTEDALFDLDATRELFTPPSTDSVAYVIFTSGSTGRPKGAMIRHGAIVERLLWQRDQILFFGRDDASLFKAPLALISPSMRSSCRWFAGAAWWWPRRAWSKTPNAWPASSIARA